MDNIAKTSKILFADNSYITQLSCEEKKKTAKQIKNMIN